MTTRAVGYVRISVDREDETSTESQEAAVRAYCKAQGWGVVEVISEKGRSAFKGPRPGLDRARELIASGGADVLVVWKLDRFGRNTIDTLTLVEELKEHGARFVSVTEQFDTTTASGDLLFTMLAALAKMESATKSERIEAWHSQRRVSGSVPTGPRPFGYERGGKDNRNVLTIKDAEADVIRGAAKRVLAGEGLRAIAADLAADGVVGTGGAPINRNTLRQVLVNPTIAAAREVESEGRSAIVQSDAWEPILDFELWGEVRAVLTDPARRTGPGNQRRWLLSGIAQCGRCTDVFKMGVVGHASGSRYSCPECHLSIEVARTDELVEHDLFAMLDPAAWQRLRRGQPIASTDTGYDKAIDELTARLKTGFIDEDEWAIGAKLLRHERDAAASVPVVQLPDVPDLPKAWPKLSLEQRRLVLSTATESLVIMPWAKTYGFDESRVQFTTVE